MPFDFKHKCNISDPEPRHFAVARGKDENGQQFTRVFCPDCREQFFILGWSMFNEAVPHNEFNLPGILLPRLPKA